MHQKLASPHKGWPFLLAVTNRLLEHRVFVFCRLSLKLTGNKTMNASTISAENTMTLGPTHTFSDAELANWDAAVERYNAIINSNAQTRVSQMSEEDLHRYSERFNTASASREDVLAHMFRWGGFRELLMSGALASNESALFARLLSGREPLPYAPPRCFKKSWYDLFDLSDVRFECAVTLKGLSTRKRDAGHRIFVLTINDCPWECSAMSIGAQRMVDIDMQWQGASEQTRSDLWLELRSLMQQSISLNVGYGQWKDTFQLTLEQRDVELGLEAALATLTQPVTDSVLGFTHRVDRFPMRWLLAK